MVRKPLNRQILLTALLDVVLGCALLVAVIYLAGLCVAGEK
jgi:hypothetical protein